MKRFLFAAVAASCLALGAAPAMAMEWRSINDRQAEIYFRIDQGVHNGSLTPMEAARLKAQFNDIAALEQRYRYTGGGLSDAERVDLDRRLDGLSRQVYTFKHNVDAAHWTPINARQAEIYARIEQGIRNGALTADEAYRLKVEFGQIAALEARYRSSAGGLTNAERADLDYRLDLLSQRVWVEKHDAQVAGWRSINDRQDEIYARIQQGVRNGALTPLEASQLRSEFVQIAALEQRYRYTGGGLSDAERADLDHRLNDLSLRVWVEKHDRDRR